MREGDRVQELDLDERILRVNVEVDVDLMLTGMMHCSNCGLGNYQSLVPASHGDAAQRCPQTRQHLSPRCCGAVLIIVGDQ